MKNLNFLFTKLSIILIILLGLNLSVSLFMNTETNKKIVANSILLYNNYLLIQNYQELNKKVIYIEKQLDSIYGFDNYIYAQILGQEIIKDSVVELEHSNMPHIAGIEPIFITLSNRISTLSSNISNKLAKFIDTFDATKENKSIIDSYPNISPLSESDTLKITSNVGWRIHPIYKIPLYHKGSDIAAKSNTKTYATMNGYVEKAEYHRYGFGNHIKIKNEYGYQLVYAHLNKIFVEEGQYVRKGQLVGETGSTGLSTAPHLHYEIRLDNELKNPVDYIYILTKNQNYLAKR